MKWILLTVIAFIILCLNYPKEFSLHWWGWAFALIMIFLGQIKNIKF